MKLPVASTLILMLCSSLFAQEKKDPVIKALYGQIGIGGGAGTILNTNISTDLNKIGLIRANFKLCYTTKGNFVENSDESPHLDEIDEFSLMYGKVFRKKPFSFTLSGGITGLRYIDLYDQKVKTSSGWGPNSITYNEKQYYFLGAGADAEAILHSKYFGIGLEGFAHYNPKLPYYGVLLNAYFGLIRR